MAPRPTCRGFVDAGDRRRRGTAQGLCGVLGLLCEARWMLRSGRCSPGPGRGAGVVVEEVLVGQGRGNGSQRGTASTGPQRRARQGGGGHGEPQAAIPTVPSRHHHLADRARRRLGGA